MKKQKAERNKLKNPKGKNLNKGITLIALIITIIVLLILAGVSIATLTGDNGVLTKASDAKNENRKAEARELIQLEAIGSYGTDGKVDIDELKANLKKNLGIAESNIVDTNGGFPVTVTYNGYTFTVDENGNVELAVVKPTVTHTISPDTEVQEGETITITITASTTDGTISKITKPDNTSVTNVNTTTYDVTANGEYIFIVEGSNGESATYTVNITTVNTTVTLEKAKADTMLNNSDNTPIEVLVEEGSTETATFILPGGFKVADDTGETINEGIVITDGESEFVWVPVNEINRMVMCKSHAEDSQCDIDFKDTNKTELVCKNHDNSEDICGKLYGYYDSSTYIFVFDKDLDAQTYSAKSGLREPALVSTYDSDTKMDADTDGNELTTTYLGTIGLTAESFQDEIDTTFKEMALSVAINGGFYVGRYELSLSDSGTALSKVNSPALTGASTKTTKIGDTNYTTYYRWYGVYDASKKYVNSKNKVKSSMIWGSQYDAMMLWMIDSGTVPNSGKYNSDRTYTGPEGDTDLINNVYDLYGGRYEWTLEAYSSGHRVFRGGYYAGSNYPRSRNVSSANNEYTYYGSRCTLYIQ